MVDLPQKIGRYEIRSELGRGMMGIVYEAHDPALTRTVALKTINPSFAASAEGRDAFERRFETEARAAGRLNHPNIVVVHDVGRDEETGFFYIALERLHGETLSALVRNGERLPWKEVLDIGRQVAAALEHLHSQGVVHRDIKPSNVMRLHPVPGREYRPVKLMDFGIAKIDTAQLTAAGQVFGTPLYMAPEQASNQTADARSDLFSLGAVLYTLLTGRDAFAANNVMATLQRVTNEDPTPPSSLNPTVPKHVDDVLARCLAKDPADRYPDARCLSEDLTDILEERPPRHRDGWTSPPPRPAAPVAGPLESLLENVSSTVTVDPAVEGSAPTRLAASAPVVRARSRWRRAGLYVDIGVVATVMAVAGWVLLRPGGFGDQAARAEPAPVPSPAVTTPPPSPLPPAVEKPPAAAAAVAETPAADAATPKPVRRLAPAQIVVDFRHPFRRCTLRIDMNGRQVLEQTFLGGVDKNLLVAKTHEGVHTDLLEVKYGQHYFDVEVRWDENVRRKRIPARFYAGQTYRLEIRIGRLRKNLSLKWTR
jgi:serine/threonine-protein kinase